MEGGAGGRIGPGRGEARVNGSPAGPGGEEEIHPLVRAAAQGRLPRWAAPGRERRAHLRRVADLMGEWAEALELPERDRVRWRAAGFLHDLMKGDDPAELRIRAGLDWPDALLHGPAMASRMRREGVEDAELLLAVSHHSVGHPSFGALGECLYIADFLDPAREFLRDRRRKLLGRMPEERRDVLPEVAALRLGRLLQRRMWVLPDSIQFWNQLVGEP